MSDHVQQQPGRPGQDPGPRRQGAARVTRCSPIRCSDRLEPVHPDGVGGSRPRRRRTRAEPPPSTRRTCPRSSPPRGRRCPIPSPVRCRAPTVQAKPRTPPPPNTSARRRFASTSVDRSGSAADVERDELTRANSRSTSAAQAYAEACEPPSPGRRPRSAWPPPKLRPWPPRRHWAAPPGQTFLPVPARPRRSDAQHRTPGSSLTRPGWHDAQQWMRWFSPAQPPGPTAPAGRRRSLRRRDPFGTTRSRGCVGLGRRSRTGLAVPSRTPRPARSRRRVSQRRTPP